MRKTKRNLKVCEQSGYKYKPTPSLMLKGGWLEEWGFTVNTPVTIQCEEGKLIITPREEISYIDAFEEYMVCAEEKQKGGY